MQKILKFYLVFGKQVLNSNTHDFRYKNYNNVALLYFLRKLGGGEIKWSVSETPEWVCAKFKFNNGTVLRQIPRYLDRQIPRYLDRKIPRYLDRQIPRNLNKQIPRYLDRQIPKCLKRQIHRYLDRQIPGQVDTWRGRYLDTWTAKFVDNGWLDSWMDR